MMTQPVVLITGATGGLGNAVTEAFLATGARVAGVSRKIQPTDFASPNFSAFPAEMTDAASSKALIDRVVAQLGRLDAVVHLVGAFAGGESVANTPEAVFDKMLDLNFRSAVHLFQGALPHLPAGGRILAIGSRFAVEPMATMAAYAASKAALVSLIRTLALEGKEKGITANIVLPGTMDTPPNRAAMPTADFSRWVDPAQVAALLVHLASPAASHISGAVIPIYGTDA